ncbi:hypothetical protein V9K67_12555 [Paraflavisolibacter sp. H34]
MHATLRTLFASILLFGWLYPQAQEPKDKDLKNFKPHISRQLFHSYVDQQQKKALDADGRMDHLFYNGPDEEVNFMITDALTKKVDRLQYKIEYDSTIAHNKKLIYLRGMENMLKTFTQRVKGRSMNANIWPSVINLYEVAINKDKRGESIADMISRNNDVVGDLLVGSRAFDANPGYLAIKQEVLRKFCIANPDKILYTLKDNPDLPFRDSLILIAAYKYPNQLYDYAAASNKLGYAIRKLNDPIVKTISRMATSGGSGQIYLPFLDNILKGKITFDEIDAVKNDSLAYYRLLVKTRLDYVQRLQAKDTIYQLQALTKMLAKKGKDVFIRTINGLHEELDPVRFKILQPLTAQELYYLIVFGEEEIYTSSYTRGVYPQMMAKIGNHGDSLMLSVRFDHFKKFIKMAAAYNTLNGFLNTFAKKGDAQQLMTAFVNGLEKSAGLEEGVDVADSYVSIAEHNKPLAEFVLNLTKSNFEKNQQQNNRRGAVMYNLLYKLFLSADTSNNVDLSQEFGIPPVYKVSYNSLANEEQKVVMQVFFYGDEDGVFNYKRFIPKFSNAGWNIVTNPTDQWVTISSTKGKPIVIYVNKPLPQEDDQDEKAQKALCSWLEENGVQPTVIVHRGHSYFAPSTIAKIPSSAKIVFLGSCGGFHLIHDVLTHASDAHIIASKQIGKTVINEPFLDLLMDKLRTGSNIDWIPFWHEFGKMVSVKDGFGDYIPPHKNLGAIFIKAYSNQMGENLANE